MSTAELTDDFKLTIGSKSFSQKESSTVSSISLEEHVDMVDMMTARIADPYDEDGLSFSIGDAVKLEINTKVMFEGEVTALEPAYGTQSGESIAVRCLDKMHRLTRGRKTKMFEEMSDADVVKKVVGDAKLSASTDSTSPKHAYILQRNESDMTFLKRLAARNDYTLRMEDGKVLFKKAQFSGNGTHIYMGDGKDGEASMSLKMSFNSADQVQEMVVRGWDPLKKEEIVGTAKESDVSKIGDGDLGLKEAKSFGTATGYVTDVPVSDQSMAKVIAKAELNRISRQYARGSVKITGDCRIRAGSMITLEGFPKGSNGRFFVVGARHVLSAATGYVTEVNFCSNCAGT